MLTSRKPRPRLLLPMLVEGQNLPMRGRAQCPDQYGMPERINEEALLMAKALDG